MPQIRENVDADQNVVDLGDDEVRVGQLRLERHRRGHEAGHASGIATAARLSIVQTMQPHIGKPSVPAELDMRRLA